MTSDKKGLETDSVNETASGFTDDDAVIDLGGAGDVSELSAGSPGYEDDFDSDLDVDITGDENIDFADEESGRPKAGGGKLKKMAAPALVLAVAAGVGGYIVMNPAILGTLTGSQSTAPVAAYTAGVSEQAPQDGAAESSVAQSGDMFSDSLPQPTVNQNEIPRSPEGEEVTEIAETEPAPSAPPVEPATVMDVTETVAADSPAAPEFPEAEVAAAAPDGWDVSEGIEQGSADETAAAPEEVASSVAAQEPSAQDDAQDLAQELYALKFSDDVPADAPAAETLTPMEEVPPAPESFEVAQAATPEVTQAEPPAMPETPPASAPPAAAPSAPEAQASQPSSGTVAQPVAPSEGSAASDVYYDGRIPTGPMATELGPRKVDPLMEPASQFVVVKKTHEAGDMESMVAAANRALQLKRYDSALEMFNQLYEKNPRDPRILMGRAVALQNSGMAESAIKTYEELLDIDPKNADAMLNMLGLLRQQYPSVALRRLTELHDRHPNNAGIAAQIGVTQADLGHPQDAMRYLGIASTLEPRNAQHVFNMAIIADRSGDAKSAVKYYEQALELDAVYSSGRSIPRESVYDRLSTLRRH